MDRGISKAETERVRFVGRRPLEVCGICTHMKCGSAAGGTNGTVPLLVDQLGIWYVKAKDADTNSSDLWNV